MKVINIICKKKIIKILILFQLIYDVTYLAVAKLGLHVVSFARGGTFFGVAHPHSGAHSSVAGFAALGPSAPRHVVAASL